MLKLQDYNVAYGQSRVINDMNLEEDEVLLRSLSNISNYFKEHY